MDTNFTHGCKTCGTVHTAKAFHALPLPGNGKGETVTGGMKMLWRNCTCGSTLAVNLGEEE